MKTDERLAHWIGIVQSDGCLKSYFDKNRKYTAYYVHVGTGAKSLPMLKKFQQISKDKFNRDVKIFKSKKRNLFEAKIGVKKLINSNLFKELDINFQDPPKPPRWLTNHSLFGAYLAGIIDGDGNVRIKRPKYPQCAIRIYSGKEQTELKRTIKNMLNCGANIIINKRDSILEGREIHGISYVLEFCVSKKNIGIFRKYVLPWISIKHKRDRLSGFIKEKYT